MKLISLFSGIGGFELAAEWMGWTPVVSCEINPFGRKVLEHYWPQAYHHTDIKTLTYEKINEELTQRFGPCWRSDDIILTGGFPCQPYSMAGKRLGKEDDRHLWPEMLRVIREVQPTWIVGENVFGLINWNGGLVFHEVQTDLEAQGYEVQPYVLPACAVNAPHRRDRVWFVAYRDRKWSGQKHELCTRGDLPEKWVDESRYSPHPNSTRCENWDKQHRGQQTQNGEGQRCTCGYCIRIDQSNAPHPNGNGLNGSDCEHEVNPSQGGEYALSNIEQMGRNAANTDNTRNASPECGYYRNGSEKSNKWKYSFDESCRYVSNRWHNFPTVSPLRSRNDGVSYKLDGITFSKWRNESIKAAGNAIVPQVALQIFKAIEKYHQLV